jgi:putative ABC transport system substrate-binding protein
MPVVGFLNSATEELYEFNLAAFRQGLAAAGFVEGKNVRIEYRWARGDYDRLPALAAELARAGVAAIAATGDVQSAKAAKAATKTIPIVFTIGGDPVHFGLVESYNQPGGNATGINLITSAMGGKRIQLLHELVPRAVVALFMNPDNPNSGAELADAQQAARQLGLRTVALNARNANEFDAAFTSFIEQGANALFVGTDPMILSQRGRLIAFAARQRAPAIYWVREFTDAGGLFSYGASIRFMYHEAGVYIGRILKGANPATIPVLQPTKVEMVINRRTARALGIEFPGSLLLRADEVIE